MGPTSVPTPVVESTDIKGQKYRKEPWPAWLNGARVGLRTGGSWVRFPSGQGRGIKVIHLHTSLPPAWAKGQPHGGKIPV